MFPKFKNAKFLVGLLLAVWVGVFSFCGFGAFMPAWLGVPHHASDSMATQCEKACLARSIANHDATIGITVEVPPQPDLKSSLMVANALPAGLDRLSPLHTVNLIVYHPSSSKRYRFFSTYRL